MKYSRDETIQYVQGSPNEWCDVLRITVLDVEDSVHDKRRIFYVFDALMVDNISAIMRSFEFRMELVRRFISIQKESIQVDSMWWSSLTTMMYPSAYDPSTTLQLTNCDIVVKPIFQIWSLKHFQSIIYDCVYPPCDGIVFNLLNDRYNTFRTSVHTCIKFKPYHAITVDMAVVNGSYPLVSIGGISALYTSETRGRNTLYIDTGQSRIYIAYITMKDTFVDGRVGEFAWVSTAWKLVRWRTGYTNSVDTVRNTIRNIMDEIKFTDLII